MTTLGSGLPGGAASWSSGFLPSNYSGALFRNEGSPVLNLENPAGISPEMQARTISAVNELNRQRFSGVKHPEIESRIKNYELAYRMQSAAPDLIDLSGESKSTIEAYGLNRQDKTGFQASFARNCLLWHGVSLSAALDL